MRVCDVCIFSSVGVKVEANLERSVKVLVLVGGGASLLLFQGICLLHMRTRAQAKHIIG